jgi:hypothetical protein
MFSCVTRNWFKGPRELFRGFGLAQGSIKLVYVVDGSKVERSDAYQDRVRTSESLTSPRKHAHRTRTTRTTHAKNTHTHDTHTENTHARRIASCTACWGKAKADSSPPCPS